MATLTLRERRELRQAVFAELDRIDDVIRSMHRSFDDIVSAQQLVGTDDEHDPEGTTIAFERTQTRALLDQAIADRAALRDTLERLDEPGFGVCAHCQTAIGAERLMALPASVLCIRCARGEGVGR